VSEFSAVGYFFGRELHRQPVDGADPLPVGLIQAAWGGTPVEAWTSQEALERCPEARPVLEAWGERIARLPEARKRHEERLAKWRTDVEAARQRGERPPREPEAPPDRKHQHHPANLFRGMVMPILPFAMRGVIWYQGEANASRAWQYRSLFPAMIRDWREQWDQGDFPFLFVQLANYKTNLAPEAWAELREAQATALALPHTAMAVTIDIGESKDIHPKNKQEVGRRLALCARALVHGEDVVASGPTYASMAVEDAAISLTFDNAEGGLIVRGGSPAGFEIAGEDRRFVAAEAVIAGNRVVLRSPAVRAPVAARYAWRDDPVANLYNQAGVPAPPFRTDDWPGVTTSNIRP
jgi:sialate O-acetylesterase